MDEVRLPQNAEYGGVAGVGGGGGNQQKFYTGKHCPEVQPLNLLYKTMSKFQSQDVFSNFSRP